MNEATLALLVPFGVFLLIGVSLWLVLSYRARKNLEIHNTVRLALDKGVDVTPELIERLGANNQPHPLQDLRRGIVWIATAVGIALFGFLVPDPSNHAFLALLGIAALPCAIGFGYLAMHQFSRQRPA
ncbi:DUF6249 domain-containing protein [Microbulbifer yueqingensis]|uniref:DUF6249 domain-containing protein n=1 Tax=Microbulbifer yueqingensis TaxID=658219 RepID=A0A1G8Y379_9GAMM|nr:DUF6249 domain-containing protein [Microbulbifer yueqingensis]SDJ96575.1 hypothetical protein SAMN05216212_1319 [Microbulbifer yueqingensis]